MGVLSTDSVTENYEFMEVEANANRWLSQIEF